MSPHLLSLIVGIAVSLGIVTATQPGEWPSLSLHFTIKRQPMQVYGQSTFTMTANPVVAINGSRVLYDATATFNQDTTTYKYLLSNGVAYLSRSTSGGVSTKCLDSDVLPSINSIVMALNTAAVIASVPENEGVQCSSGELYKVSVDGTDFALCYSGSAGFTMHGSDMDIVVEYVKTRVDISVPTMNIDSANKCALVASSSALTPIGSALLTGASIPSTKARRLKAAFDFSSLKTPPCKCKSTPRPCIFIHGMGIKPEMPENQQHFPKYWGKLADHAPCCSSMEYARLDTVNNAWTSAAQQQKVCDRALAASKTTQGATITDTIIITHSMGGLMLSGAIANGFCGLDSSSSWLSLGAPMRGSMGSDYTQDACDGDNGFVLEKFANVTGRCPVSVATRSLAYEKGDHASAKLNAAYKAAQKVYRTRVTAVACSNSYSGLLSDYQWQFWMLGKVVPHKSPQNDGMVEFQSCRGGIPESKFGDSYLDPFYVSRVNHFDLQFLSGDAVLDKSKMPAKWFECVL
ncbi:hypothetical protein PHYBOEH_011948 [Phytophthora boehmeriae]|uniref:Uncharacterized protein n=1 Tax=Phytophthora boehmeriae TaxID=109152 RepID=A0A8T1VEA4_9STRA|nr:hypothetical protein PHYBOEH_011948 [Phytophthora boehmeriae]